MFSTSFWLALSIVIFICLIFKSIKSFVLNALGNRVQSIEVKFQEIFTISKEAEELLRKYKLLCESSEEKAKEIIASAEDEIKDLRANAEIEIANKLKALSESISNKINNDEAKTLMELRMKSIKLAIATALEILSSNKNHSYQDQLINASIDAISSQFKEKSTF